ncbi:MAG: DUF4105 domain-containing protein [Gemmatimonadetes bacterium]|nr:DUF4105 domain-containing protein [Gemmatimonadota bacterium]MYE95174.1 DUF4105 domain-containing protein [Gemmatimonadota bacterium]MYJ09214.1 DUF4105 domain-containing protein [Gemmatimonadota bacterium]
MQEDGVMGASRVVEARSGRLDREVPGRLNAPVIRRNHRLTPLQPVDDFLRGNVVVLSYDERRKPGHVKQQAAASRKGGLRLTTAFVPAFLASAALVAPAAQVAGLQDPTEADTAAAAAVPGSSLSVHLLTMEPGDAIWELFGHNALVISDRATGYAQAFHYGLFNRFSEGFYFRFLKGRMMYGTAAVQPDRLIAAYRAQNRRVWSQELDLEPRQKAEMLRLLETAVLPENMRYRYEYYLNNCSTKLRDVIDVVLDGQLQRATDGSATGTNWREQTRRLTAADPFGYVGIDLLLGPMGDEPTNRWQEMWIPMKLRDTVGGLWVNRSDGSRVRLVGSEVLLVNSDRSQEAAGAPSVIPLFLLCGMLVALLLLLVGRAAHHGALLARLGLGLFGGLWGGFCFIAGAILIAVHWTDHEFMYWNQNVLLFSPLGAGVAFALIRVSMRGRTSRWGRRVAIAALGLAGIALLLNLIPALASGNRELVVLTVPIHLAVCWIMLRV